MYYILKKPSEGETMSHCAATDALTYSVRESAVVHDENFLCVRSWLEDE